MILSGGGGSWFKWSDKPKGTKVVGQMQSFTADVPGTFGKQDILRLEVDGETVNMSCPAQLGSVFKRNTVAEGTTLAITYNGKKSIKGGKTAHDFLVETIDDDVSFPPATAATPKSEEDEDAALEAKLAAIKAKKEGKKAA